MRFVKAIASFENFRTKRNQRRQAALVAATSARSSSSSKIDTFSLLTHTMFHQATQPFTFSRSTQYEVDVHLDSPTGTIGHTFSNTTGQDIVDCGSNTNFLFVDQVPAALKPTTDGTNDGIKVQGGSGDTLEIDAGIDDTYIQLTSSTSTRGVQR